MREQVVFNGILTATETTPAGWKTCRLNGVMELMLHPSEPFYENRPCFVIKKENGNVEILWHHIPAEPSPIAFTNRDWMRYETYDGVPTRKEVEEKPLTPKQVEWLAFVAKMEAKGWECWHDLRRGSWTMLDPRVMDGDQYRWVGRKCDGWGSHPEFPW